MVKPPSITTERNNAMALDQSALLEVLDALRNAAAAGGSDHRANY